jgi:amino acid transporter
LSSPLSSLPSESRAPSTASAPRPHFVRSLGLFSALAVNLTQMCGVGPFVTIPLLVAAMGGPQALVGWVVGALLAIADGLVWAELGAAMPGAGGTYLYLREAFQYRTGRLMPFLFVWTAMIAIPLMMSTGVIGIIQYLGYYLPALSGTAGHVISVAIVVLVVFALYRDIASIGKLTNALCVVMFLTVGIVIAASLTHFSPALAFSYPPDAFHLGRPFFVGLGAGLIIALYDYAGYYTTAYMAGELRNPGRVLPRSIVGSILGMMVIYLVMNVGVLGVVPWKEVAASTSIGSLVMERTWGTGAARILTGLIIITALASVFTGLLGGSRVPCNAAKDRLFFPIFGRLHPKLNFPHVALLVMGVVTAIGTFLPLDTVINLLTAVMVLIQSIGQIAALITLRRRQPDLPRPYRMWGYPIVAWIAAAGWLYIYVSSGLKMMLLSLAWLTCGIVAFLIWARAERSWPFGPKEIREEFRGGKAMDALD